MIAADYPHKVAHKLGAGAAFAALDHHLWFDLADKLTCTEAEVFADLLRAYDADEAAEGLLSAHADADDEGDYHYKDGAK